MHRLLRVFVLVVALGAVAPSTAAAAFTDEARNNANAASAATVFKPRNTVAPSVVGTPRDGVATAGSAGTWDRQPASYAYAWQRCDSTGASCAAISGATTLTYTPVPADVGGTLRLVVTATNTGGSTVATSAASAVVEQGQPRAGGAPAITGTATTGSTLTTTDGTWTGAAPITYVRQWQRCTTPGVCTDVTGQTGTTYAVTTADSGYTLRVVVTAANAYGTATQTTTETAKVNWEVSFVDATSFGDQVRRSSIALTRPTGVAAGDLLVAMLVNTGATTFSGPAGWTQTTSLQSGAFSVWTRTATASETATYTFTSSYTNGYIGGVVAAYRDANTAAGAVTVGTTGPQASAPVAFPTFASAPGATIVAGLFNTTATTRGTVTHTGYTWRGAGYSNDSRGGARTERAETALVDTKTTWGAGNTWSGWGTQGAIALRVPPKP